MSKKLKPTVTLPGKVEKVIPAIVAVEPEKAQIAVEGADPLYREIRVENSLKDEKGDAVALKEGAHVEVTIEANSDAIEPEDLSKKNLQHEPKGRRS